MPVSVGSSPTVVTNETAGMASGDGSVVRIHVRTCGYVMAVRGESNTSDGRPRETPVRRHEPPRPTRLRLTLPPLIVRARDER